MSAPVPEIEPAEFFAGDTVAWTKDLSDYPATTWTLAYSLVGPSRQTITATASGRTFSVSVAKTTTAGWPPGEYKWYAFVSAGSERYQVGSGSLTIKENFALTTNAQDTRSDARIILDSLMALYKQVAGRPERRYTLQAVGREFEFYTHADLIKAIQFWQGIVKQEEDAEKVARGENTGKNIFVRFT